MYMYNNKYEQKHSKVNYELIKFFDCSSFLSYDSPCTFDLYTCEWFWGLSTKRVHLLLAATFSDPKIAVCRVPDSCWSRAFRDRDALLRGLLLCPASSIQGFVLEEISVHIVCRNSTLVSDIM